MSDVEKLSKKQIRRYRRVLNLAEELVYENGFYKLSVADLTEKLRVSRSTIYDYFGSKEGLVEVIVDRLNDRLDNEMKLVLQKENLTVAEKFLAIAQQQGSVLKGKQEQKLLSELKAHLPELHQKLVKGRQKRKAVGYKPLILKGIEEGLFDPKLKQEFILELYLNMARLVSDTDILVKSGMQKAEANRLIIEIFLNGCKNVRKNKTN